MKKLTFKTNYFLFTKSLILLFAAFLIIPGCRKPNDRSRNLKNFVQTNLVANNNEYNAATIDPTLINGWGLAFSSGGTPWVNSQDGHVSEVYSSEGMILRPGVNIPSPGGPTGGNPSGIVFSSSATDFLLPAPNSQPARFIFAGLDGVLSAWNGAAGDNAVAVSNESTTSVYTGLAIGWSNNANYIYAANFKEGSIDVYDKEFEEVEMSFKDPHLPAGYAPFNIQAVGDWLYVMYAKVAASGEEEAGMGNGYVSIFKTDGSFVKRFASKGALNAPWGIAKAPASFFHDDADDNENHEGIILVGNFGNGRINAYKMDGRFLGELWTHSAPIEIEGLWGISFPPVTATAIDPNRLYFAAGPDEETHGLFGYISKKSITPK